VVILAFLGHRLIISIMGEKYLLYVQCICKYVCLYIRENAGHGHFQIVISILKVAFGTHRSKRQINSTLPKFLFRSDWEKIINVPIFY